MPTEKPESRIRSVNDFVKPYLERYEMDRRERPNSIIFAKGRLAHVKRLLGTVLLSDLTEDAIRDDIRLRLKESASRRTINMEVGELSRAICKPWSILRPKVPKQEERTDVGQALSPEQEDRLLQTAGSNKRWKMGANMIRIALFTGGRQIPMNEDLFNLLTAHGEWFEGKFGKPLPAHYLFPFGTPAPSDPTRPTTMMKTVWGTDPRTSQGRFPSTRSEAHGGNENG